MQPQQLKAGDVVQISPEYKDCFFPGCYMQVTEPKSWGAQGFILIPQSQEDPPGKAYFRCRWEYMEYIGKAVWIAR